MIPAPSLIRDGKAVGDRQGGVVRHEAGGAAAEVAARALALPQALLRARQAAAPAVPLRAAPAAASARTVRFVAVPMLQRLISLRTGASETQTRREREGREGGSRTCSQGWASACSAVKRLYD